MSIRDVFFMGYSPELVVPGIDVIEGNISSVSSPSASLVIPTACKNDFNVDLDTDIDEVFLNSDDFTTEAIYTDIDLNQYIIYGIFDDPYVSSQPDTEIGVQSVGPTFKCKLSDIEDISGSVRKGDKILICEKEYRVQESQPDGVDLTVLTLKFP
jgi:hypothetical protein